MNRSESNLSTANDYNEALGDMRARIYALTNCLDFLDAGMNGVFAAREAASARMLLGSALGRITGHDPYARARAKRQHGEQVRAQTADLPGEQLKLEGTQVEKLDRLRHELDQERRFLEETLLPQYVRIGAAHYVLAFMEQAVVKLTLARGWLGVALARRDDLEIDVSKPEGYRPESTFDFGNSSSASTTSFGVSSLD